MGYHAAKFLSEDDGVKITAVIERDGALIQDDGIDIEHLHQHIIEHGSIKNFPGARFEEHGRAVLEKACDILIPAALEAQITLENAPRIQAKLIVEAANGPLTYGADELDLVRSGLDDTMRLAYQQIRETLLGDDKINDLRTAAYVSSIRKIARSCLDVGVY